MKHVVRGYQIRVEVWGEGIAHKKPVLELYLEGPNVTVSIADDYQHLEGILEKMLAMVKERGSKP